MRLELDLPALERLIGGDTEIGLRKKIVQEFAKRHLREVAETATYEAAMDAAKKYVNEAAKEAFGIENLVTSHLLLKTIEYQKHYWSREVSKMVEKAVDRQIEKEVEEGIRKRLEAAAKSL